jgi:hypothetical protein
MKTYNEKLMCVEEAMKTNSAEAILKSIGIHPHHDPADILEWVAEHVTGFAPLLNSADLEYIGKDGHDYRITWLSKAANPSLLDCLIGCVTLAQGQEKAKEQLTHDHN